MSAVLPVPLDLPDAGDGEASCSSKSKGFVLTVDKCLEHDHYIKLRSLGTYELTVDTDSITVVGGDSSLEVGGGASVSIGGKLSAEVSGDAHLSVAGDASLVCGGGATVEAAGDVTIKAGGRVLIEGDSVQVSNLMIMWGGRYVSLVEILRSFEGRIAPSGG